MKILLDACVWGKTKERLTQEGHDVVWAGDWLEDPGDIDILKRAHA
jgi:predicted nuclease of predicted toxin-antitoxin system